MHSTYGQLDLHSNGIAANASPTVLHPPSPLSTTPILSGDTPLPANIHVIADATPTTPRSRPPRFLRPKAPNQRPHRMYVLGDRTSKRRIARLYDYTKDCMSTECTGANKRVCLNGDDITVPEDIPAAEVSEHGTAEDKLQSHDRSPSDILSSSKSTNRSSSVEDLTMSDPAQLPAWPSPLISSSSDSIYCVDDGGDVIMVQASGAQQNQLQQQQWADLQPNFDNNLPPHGNGSGSGLRQSGRNLPDSGSGSNSQTRNPSGSTTTMGNWGANGGCMHADVNYVARYLFLFKIIEFLSLKIAFRRQHCCQWCWLRSCVHKPSLAPSLTSQFHTVVLCWKSPP